MFIKIFGIYIFDADLDFVCEILNPMDVYSIAVVHSGITVAPRMPLYFNDIAFLHTHWAIKGKFSGI